MSNEKNALDAMLKQYEKNNTPKYTKNETAKVYDLKNYFNTFIKEGVKSGTKQIRILPPTNGSSPFVEMYGHKIQVDGDWKTFPCLKHEKNEACPFCEAYDMLKSTGKDDAKELAKKYNARLMYVVKVIDRDAEEEGVKFWRFNHDYRKEGIYDKIHGVLNAIKKDVTDPQTGRDLLITINRNQSGAPIVSAVASLDPSPLSTDTELSKTWLDDNRNWEDVYSVRTYEYLEIIVKGGIPVWDKEAKKFVDKVSLKADTTDASEEDITIGLETVKSTVKAATSVPAAVTPEAEDDLPF